MTSNEEIRRVTVFMGGADPKEEHRNFGPADLSLTGSVFEVFVTSVEMRHRTRTRRRRVEAA